MKQHGMLYKAAMVLALMRDVDPKWQTRRPITFSNSICTPHVRRDEWKELRWSEAWLDESGPSPAGNPGPYWHVPFRDIVVRVYPRVRPGDRLWVRETFMYSLRGNDTEKGYEDGIEYKADGTFKQIDFPKRPITDDYRWKSPLHLPRWASRIDLEVLKMRSQRIKDISAMDAVAEGIERSTCSTVAARVMNEKNAFRALWDSINVARGYAWEGNHPVWIHDLERIKPAWK